MKVIETSKGSWQVIEINSICEGQFYVDTLSSEHYKLSEITPREATNIIALRDMLEVYTPSDFKKELIRLLMHKHNIEVTSNIYLFKVLNI